jgi:hypothetical protein
VRTGSNAASSVAQVASHPDGGPEHQLELGVVRHPLAGHLDEEVDHPEGDQQRAEVDPRQAAPHHPHIRPHHQPDHHPLEAADRIEPAPPDGRPRGEQVGEEVRAERRVAGGEPGGDEAHRHRPGDRQPPRAADGQPDRARERDDHQVVLGEPG